MSGTLVIGIVVVVAWSILAALLGLKFWESRQKKQLKAQLKRVVDERPEPETRLLKEAGAGAGGLLEKLLDRLNVVHTLDRHIRQAGLSFTASQLALRMACFAGAGAAAGMMLPLEWPALYRVPALAIVAGLLPYLGVRRKRSKRMARFEEQFPEALDFLARSMRAGHAFSISLEMLSEEMPEPVGHEFRTVFHETNLGAPLEAALKNLCERVPLLDVRFFASAVMLQKQTGGNLSEILTRLAYVIRERFRLKGQVRAASAHGRMTALVLMALPVVTAMALMVVAPGYLQGMADDSDGKRLIVAAIAAQVIGNLVIRKIINIKV